MLATLILSLLASVSVETTPVEWKILKDSRGLCQIAVPSDWDEIDESTGAAVFHDTSTAVAVVTSQPGQAFKPLTEPLQRLLGIRRAALFENTPRRIFYQDKVSKRPGDPNVYDSSVPGKSGTCSCHVAALPSIAEETAKRIVLTLQPAPD
jgi:hypothetical protein